MTIYPQVLCEEEVVMEVKPRVEVDSGREWQDL
jgi:hypothetical protein